MRPRRSAFCAVGIWRSLAFRAVWHSAQSGTWRCLELYAQSGHECPARQDCDVVRLIPLIVEQVVSAHFEREHAANVARRRGMQAETAVVAAPVLTQLLTEHVVHAPGARIVGLRQSELIVVDPVHCPRSTERRE